MGFLLLYDNVKPKLLGPRFPFLCVSFYKIPPSSLITMPQWGGWIIKKGTFMQNGIYASKQQQKC